MGNEASAQNITYGQRLLNDINVKWQNISVENLCNGRDGHCAVGVDKKLIAFGGICFSPNDGGYIESNELMTLDIESRTWKRPTVKGQLPLPRSSASLVAIGNKLYLFGGLCQEKGWLNDLHVFNLDTNEWTLVAPSGDSPSPRDKLGAVAMGTKIVYFGGFGPTNEGIDDDGGADFTWFNDVYVLDTDNLSWSKPSPSFLGCPTPRAAFGMSAVETKIYIFGGRDSVGRKTDLYILDTETYQWSKPNTSGCQPKPRSFHTCTSVGKRIVVFGGRGIQDEHYNDVHIFDTETLEWLQPSCSGTVPSERGVHAACIVNDSFVVYGGSSKFDKTTMQCQEYHADIFTIPLEQILSGKSQGPDPTDVPASSSASTEAEPNGEKEDDHNGVDLEAIEEDEEDGSDPDH